MGTLVEPPDLPTRVLLRIASFPYWTIVENCEQIGSGGLESGVVFPTAEPRIRIIGLRRKITIFSKAPQDLAGSFSVRQSIF